MIVGTVGPTALDAAKQDVQACFDEHCGAITQEQLDTAHERIKGEVAVRTDYTSDIHALVHGHLVGGEKPTIEVEKPSLEDVNRASEYLRTMSKVAITPPMQGAQGFSASAKGYMGGYGGDYGVEYGEVSSSDEECEVPVQF